MGSKKPSKRVVQFLFTSRHTVPTSIPSSNYSPNLRRSCVKLPHILSRMPHSPSGASARPSPHVSIKSLELNALHTSQIQDMVHLNGNRSNALVAHMRDGRIADGFVTAINLCGNELAKHFPRTATSNNAQPDRIYLI